MSKDGEVVARLAFFLCRDDRDHGKTPWRSAKRWGKLPRAQKEYYYARAKRILEVVDGVHDHDDPTLGPEGVGQPTLF